MKSDDGEDKDDSLINNEEINYLLKDEKSTFSINNINNSNGTIIHKPKTCPDIEEFYISQILRLLMSVIEDNQI